MAEAETASELRHRAPPPPDDKPTTTTSSNDGKSKEKEKGDVVWGRTPSGTVFRVPTTHDVVRALLLPSHPKSHLDILNLSSLFLHFLLSPSTRRIFFFLYFAFWRAAYDAGLGTVLIRYNSKLTPYLSCLPFIAVFILIQSHKLTWNQTINSCMTT